MSLFGRLIGSALVLVTATGACGSDPDETAVDLRSTSAGEATVGSPSFAVEDDGGDTVDEATATEESTHIPTSAETTTSTPLVPGAVADASVIEDAVDARRGTDVDFAALVDPLPVAVGDTLRTDTSGYAQIEYFDGSITRLDVDTEFDVIELIDTPDESTIRTRMGLGRTWHRVNDLAETDTYAVETSVATAVVQGTAFTIDCPDDTTCTFVVVEGEIVLEFPGDTPEPLTLTAPAAVTVNDQGPGDIVPVPFDAAFGDDWLFDNADRDTTNGQPSAADIYQTHGPTYASINGTFTGTIEFTDIECTADCERWEEFHRRGFRRLDSSGTIDVAVDSECDRSSCSTNVSVVAGADGAATIGEAASTHSSNAADIEVDIDRSTFICLFDRGDGAGPQESGEASVELRMAVSPASAELDGLTWIADRLVGELEQSVEVVVPGECELVGATSGGYTAIYEVVLDRVP